MDPLEALRHIRTLIRAALDADDIETLHRLLKEMKEIADKALRRA